MVSVKKSKNFEYNSDQTKVLKLLHGRKKTILMAAPSFVIDFEYLSFVPTMKGLGFDIVSELTFGAKIVNENYHKYILSNKNKQKKFIASVCPSIVAIVKTQFPEMKKFLLPFDSPMVATAKVLRKQNPNYKIIFLAPCNAKKIEAKESGIIDGVVNFTEMKEIIQNEQPCAINSTEKSHLFDRFYNDFTKIYPLGGGLSATLHSKDILKKNEIICCDNCKLVSIKKIFNKYMGKNEKKFFDLLFCPGGCIGGPGVESKSSIARRRKKILDYRSFANKEKIGKRKGLTKYTKGISFRKKFD